MASGILRALNIEVRERGIVLSLLAQSVFLGIFAGSLDVGANSLFLESYSAELMPRAFMFSGLVGILFTTAYAALQKRIPFKLFTILNFFVVLVFTGLLRLGYYIDSSDERLAFVLLVMMGPLILVSLLGFWGTAGRYFSLREGKRLFGLIDTGAVVGMIVAFYAVPLLLQVNFKVYDTLLIGAGGLLLAMIVQLITLRRFQFAPQAGRDREQKVTRSGIIGLLRNRYTRLMVFFVALSVVTGFFVHYLFVSVTEVRYTDSRELTGFLGAFFGTMMVFTVIIKGTLYGWMMKNYGLRLALIIGPVLLFLFVAIAAVMGTVYPEFGSSAASGFTFFFLVIALSKLFNKSLKDSIESPSMKILYQSLDSSERYDVQARIDGTVNELTAFIAGLVMAGLIFLSFIGVIHFIYFLLAILVMWAFLGVWLYRSYRGRLNESLASVISADTESEAVSQDNEQLLNPCLVGALLKLDPYCISGYRGDEIAELLATSDRQTQLSILEEVRGRTVVYSEAALARMEGAAADPAVSSYAKQAQHWCKSDPDLTKSAFRSKSSDEKTAALYAAVISADRSQVPHIITLLRDRDMTLRSRAIDAAWQLGAKELCSYLVDYLSDPELYEVTWHALVKFGTDALDSLENAFHKSGVTVDVQLRIIQAMIAIGGESACRLLFKKVDFHQREVRNRVLEGLYLASFPVDEKQRVLLRELLYDTVQAGGWNLAAEQVISENDPGNGLLEAVREERSRMEIQAFRILAIMYDRQVIDHIRDGILDEEGDDSGFAMELLSLVVDEEVYSYLEPYFDETGIAEKIRRLQVQMPVEIIEYKELLKEMVSRDSLYMNNYARICALDAIGKNIEVYAVQQLIAQVFHPEKPVRDTAAAVLYEKDREAFQNVSSRFSQPLEERIDPAAMALLSGHNPHLQWTRDLKQSYQFSGVSHEVLFKLANMMTATEESGLNDEVTLIELIREMNIEEGLHQARIRIAGDEMDSSDEESLYATPAGMVTYSIKIRAFRELLFFEPDLLKVVRRHMFTSDSESGEEITERK